MGNRAVITTKENWENNGVGIYLHWNGSRPFVEGLLAYCDAKGFRAPENDCYGFAYMTTVMGNVFGDGLSLGVDTLDHLDCDNWDNGVYIIEDWAIVDRKYFERGEDSSGNGIKDVISYIDSFQPDRLKLTEKEWEYVNSTYV